MCAWWHANMGQNYWAMYAPVFNWASICILLAVAKMLRNAASALLLSQSPFIEIYLNLTSTSTGESTPPVHHDLISCQSGLLYLLSTFE